MQHFQTGQNFGQYQILEEIGQGGMATVYKAVDARLNRVVAIKILTTGNQPDVFFKRFEREAQTLAQLSHPHIVRILDYGQKDGVPYLVMEYVAGGSLNQRTGRAYTVAEAARLLAPVASALAYIHSKRVIHRDVKPANILMTETGQPVLTDFGIVKLLDLKENQPLTGSGGMVGTPSYMSPEQITGDPVDGRADIYALGVIFFELVTGRKPYVAQTPIETTLKQLNEPVPSPRDLVKDLPPEADQIVLKSMAKLPEDRYPHMADFAKALEDLARSGQPEGAQPYEERTTGLIYRAGDIIFDRYRVEKLIGTGAFGEVYQVEHISLGIPMAVKVLRRDMPDVGSTVFASFQERFELEARLSARLQHPNIIRVFDFFKENNTLLLVMDYAAGGSLAQKIKAAFANKKPIPVDEAIKIGLDLAQGLAELHTHEIIHRDLKPSNILFDEFGRAMISDLGIAQAPGGITSRSVTGAADTPRHPGTPAYMSPEQEETRAYLKPPSDVFSLGLILFELLTGRNYKIFPARTRVSKLRRDVPAALDQLIYRMLSPKPEDRPWDGQALEAELRKLQSKASLWPAARLYGAMAGGVLLVALLGYAIFSSLPAALPAGATRSPVAGAQITATPTSIPIPPTITAPPVSPTPARPTATAHPSTATATRVTATATASPLVYRAKIKSSYVYLRWGPFDACAGIVRLPQNEEVTILKRNQNSTWVQAQTTENKVGWLLLPWVDLQFSKGDLEKLSAVPLNEGQDCPKLPTDTPPETNHPSSSGSDPTEAVPPTQTYP